MQHLRIRCKHCQREYTYCTYGNGPEYGTENGCSMEYCADCQKAIDEALEKIPKKYTWRWLDICPTLGLLEALAETKEKVEKARNESVLLTSVPNDFFYSPYDNIDTYVRDGVEYMVEWNDSTPNNKRVLVKMEYDLTHDCFTDNAWRVGEREAYRHIRPFKLKVSEAPSMAPSMAPPMDPPLGKMFYFGPVDSELPKVEKRKPRHIRREYSKVYDGATVKRLLTDEYEAHKCRNGCPGVNPDDLYDFMNYECVFVNYDDEEFETITKIRVK